MAAYGRQGAAIWRRCGIKFLEEVGFGKKISDLKSLSLVRKDEVRRRCLNRVGKKWDVQFYP